MSYTLKASDYLICISAIFLHIIELAKKQILHESSKVDEYLTVSQAYVTAPDVKVPDEFSKLFKTVDEVLSYIFNDILIRFLQDYVEFITIEMIPHSIISDALIYYG